MDYLDSYLHRLKKLRVDSDKVEGVTIYSPYKPALLLAVIEGIEERLILDNRIEITPELISGFKAYCQLLRNRKKKTYSPRCFKNLTNRVLQVFPETFVY